MKIKHAFIATLATALLASCSTYIPTEPTKVSLPPVDSELIDAIEFFSPGLLFVAGDDSGFINSTIHITMEGRLVIIDLKKVGDKNQFATLKTSECSGRGIKTKPELGPYILCVFRDQFKNDVGSLQISNFNEDVTMGGHGLLIKSPKVLIKKGQFYVSIYNTNIPRLYDIRIMAAELIRK